MIDTNKGTNTHTGTPTITQSCAEHPSLTVSRIEYMELMLDRLSRQVMQRCTETHSASEDMKQTLDKARMAGGLIRSYQHLIDMREALIARNPDELTAPKIGEHQPLKKKSSEEMMTETDTKKISEDQRALIDAAIEAPETRKDAKDPLKTLRQNYRHTDNMKKNLNGAESMLS